VIPLIQSSGLWSLTDFVSLPDGRVIYVRDGNLWELRIDSRSGTTTEIHGSSQTGLDCGLGRQV
jgi:hypothetical protein